MNESLRVVHLGLGPIGREAVKLSTTRRSLRVVGAVDIDPAITGRDLGEITGSPAAAGILVERDLRAALGRLSPDIVLQTTGSRLRTVLDQIETVVESGSNIGSTTEELFYPFLRNPAEARRIDGLARERGVTVLGTGVNPGFAMDTLALCLSGVCRRIESVTINRVVDASTRRGPLQRKVGAGLSPREFRSLVDRHELGHVGLVESLQMLAAALGLEIEGLTEAIEPVISQTDVVTPHVKVSPGQVAGIHHTAMATIAGRGMIHLDLRMYVGATDPCDEIIIEGDPPIRNRVIGGIAGDAATVAMLVNSAPRVVAAPPGLLTVAELPPIGWFA